ncbi:MAG: molybdopterin cofactor-binding domain-containing protein, partial [Steroidobacteraceae bacterium]
MRRRDFLLVSAGSASGALLGLLEAGSAAPAAASVAGPGTADDGRFVVTAWLALERDGGARVRVHKSEMGQGVLTALPMLIAEELDLPLERV